MTVHKSLHQTVRRLGLKEFQSWGCSSVTECPCSTRQALCSIPSPTQKGGGIVYFLLRLLVLIVFVKLIFFYTFHA